MLWFKTSLIVFEFPVVILLAVVIRVVVKPF